MQAAAVYARLLGYWLILAVVTLAIPGPADGQTADRVYRLGALMLSAGSVERVRAYLLPVLARQGFVEGRNLVLEVRIGTVGELPALAGELLASKPDVILANGLMAIRAIRAHSNAVPIVGAFIDGDPVAAGFAAGLARPGGNVTGVVMLAPELDAKRLEFLHEVVPTAGHVAVLRVSPKRGEESLAADAGLRKYSASSCCPFMRRFLRFIRQPLPRCGRQAHRGWRSSRPLSSLPMHRRLPRSPSGPDYRPSANGERWLSRAVSSATVRTLSS